MKKLTSTQSNWEISDVETVFRIKLVFPTADRASVYTWLDENYFKIVDQGPYTDAEMHPKVDSSKMIIYAEKVVKV